MVVMASMTVTVCLDWFYRACFNRHEELKLWLFKQAKQLQEEVAQSRKEKNLCGCKMIVNAESLALAVCVYLNKTQPS